MTSSPTFALHPTPLGEALLLFSPAGLLALDLLHERTLTSALERWSRGGPAPEPATEREPAEAIGAQLDEYFDGERESFDIPLDWSFTGGFATRALRAVVEVPYAETASYGEIAVRAGSPRAHRAVGAACRQTPFSLVVPVHRVVRADGTPGLYGAHPETKRFLLRLEAEAHAARVGGLPARRPGPTF